MIVIGDTVKEDDHDAAHKAVDDHDDAHKAEDDDDNLVIVIGDALESEDPV